MTGKTISKSAKVKLVLSSLGEDVVVTKFCLEHKIPRRTFYRWRKQVLDALSEIVSVREQRSRGKHSSRSRNHSQICRGARYKCRFKE